MLESQPQVLNVHCEVNELQFVLQAYDLYVKQSYKHRATPLKIATAGSGYIKNKWKRSIGTCMGRIYSALLDFAGVHTISTDTQSNAAKLGAENKAKVLMQETYHPKNK